MLSITIWSFVPHRNSTVKQRSIFNGAIEESRSAVTKTIEGQQKGQIWRHLLFCFTSKDSQFVSYISHFENALSASSTLLWQKNLYCFSRLIENLPNKKARTDKWPSLSIRNVGAQFLLIIRMSLVIKNGIVEPGTSFSLPSMKFWKWPASVQAFGATYFGSS